MSYNIYMQRGFYFILVLLFYFNFTLISAKLKLKMADDKAWLFLLVYFAPYNLFS